MKMPAPIAIVGQGLAGTLLAWELERHGAQFQICDAGPVGRASAVAAGMINPITGQRLVKSWRVEELLPLARECYRALEAELGVKIWREMRVHRWWRNESERGIFVAKQQGGGATGATDQLAPFAGATDHDGFWIEGAAQVDVPALLAATRRRWLAAGCLIEGEVNLSALRARHELVILCTGAPLRAEPSFTFVPWSVSRGEVLTVAVAGLEPGVILNNGHWVAPLGAGEAKVGATYTPNADDLAPTPEARTKLERAAETLLRRPFQVRQHEAGLRLALPDKHPVAGRCPNDPRLGLMSGLGSKGVLLAPWLARQWWNHLSEGVPFDPAVDVARFWRR
jgi:glycine oxidase